MSEEEPHRHHTNPAKMTDHELEARIAHLENGQYRLAETPTVEAIEARVHSWLSGYREQVERLNADELDVQLDTLGAGVLLSVPAIAQQVERAIIERVARGMTTRAELRERLNHIKAELQICHAERAIRRRHGGTRQV